MLKPYSPTEHQEQVVLFQWASIEAKRIPELELLHAIPNGGSRHPAEAKNLKAAGVKPGVPDLCLPVARGKHHGLYIELKSSKGKLSEYQEKWISRLNQQGYMAVCCFGFEDARSAIMSYLFSRS